ncbi:MAG: outer membrane protein assembly factor BamE [Candidatus Omnitrophica bacterium]|nr:outer membrane protein assembly factor BamE [Candidatus Omnitrophota bacterium]MBU1996943.1 outer membrane protein assembly factor BamE [Candidatus Omnitrophota bacterium]MBU4333950.1 outer membrane protein assembly factor BamE [Candidatus Omnitrophota bacterium]
MRNFLILFFAIFVLQGCATTKTAKIDTGMSKAQVIDTWGQPRSIQTAKNSAQRDNFTEKWYYYKQKDGKAKLPEKCVILEDGKAAYSFVF